MTYRSLHSGRYADMPSCVGKLPLGIAIAQLCGLACDVDPDELGELAARGEPVLRPTFRWLLDYFQSGEVSAWQRALGGGLPHPVPTEFWHIDDPAPRFISSQLSVSSPFDSQAPADSWLFIDEGDYASLWNSVVAAIEQHGEVRRPLPRLPSQRPLVIKGTEISEASSPDKLLSLGDVIDKVRLSRGAIYGRISEKAFPAPIKIGRSSRWLQSELDEWIADFRKT